MIRLSPDASIPHHHESVPMHGWVRAAGWVAALGSVGGGLLVVALTDGRLAELAGPCLVIVGGVLLVLVVRCRICEVTVGSARIEVGAGPFRRMVPSAAVETAKPRRATAWRRLYADAEVVLRVSVGSGELSVPSRRPAELVEAVSELS